MKVTFKINYCEWNTCHDKNTCVYGSTPPFFRQLCRLAAYNARQISITVKHQCYIQITILSIFRRESRKSCIPCVIRAYVYTHATHLCTLDCM